MSAENARTSEMVRSSRGAAGAAWAQSQLLRPLESVRSDDAPLSTSERKVADHFSSAAYMRADLPNLFTRSTLAPYEISSLQKSESPRSEQRMRAVNASPSLRSQSAPQRRSASANGTRPISAQRTSGVRPSLSCTSRLTPRCTSSMNSCTPSHVLLKVATFCSAHASSPQRSSPSVRIGRSSIGVATLFPVGCPSGSISSTSRVFRVRQTTLASSAYTSHSCTSLSSARMLLVFELNS
mmetsp:Transcript_36816/g.85035  ORF Transcript_36816/g.85035 Transcript_36816/m.85035 type:complete len:239 (-) Transcript_36816:348-1064(-)